MTNGVKINFKFVAQVNRFGPLPEEPVDLTEAQHWSCANCHRSLIRISVCVCESVRHAALGVACGNGEWHDPKTEKGKRKRKMKMKSRQSKVNATTASHRRNQLALCDDVDVEVGSDSDSDRVRWLRRWRWRRCHMWRLRHGAKQTV